VDGRGRLVIDEDQAVDQNWVVWGIETNRYYTFTDSTGSGGLFYQAESRTALGGSAIAVGPAGASGAGSNVMRNTSLPTSNIAILSTQATAGGAHLSHVGTFRVYARVQAPATNAGTVSIALQWGDGDFRRFTTNAGTSLDPSWEASWRLVDLGLVDPSKVTSGTQQWEGRILARSTEAGDDIDIDWLMLVPADWGSGVISKAAQTPAPTGYSARDDFDQTAGALTAKTLPIGGTWAGAGDADDFNVTGSGAITRTAVSDASVETGRYATASTPTLGNVAAGMSWVSFSNPVALNTAYGVIVRYVDTSNWLMLRMQLISAEVNIRLLKRVAGTVTELGSIIWGDAGNLPALVVRADAAGNFAGWALSSAGASLGTPDIQGQDTVLATGGTLATGKVGIYDVNSDATANTRTYDSFWAYTFASDAAVFASQSLEINSDGVRREDSGGTMWVPPSVYVGDYLRVPPSGAEARTIRAVVKGSRSIPGQGADAGTDDISAKLFQTPRYL
jgi:hypothetical protein